MGDYLISISPDILGGTPVFAGSRVPVQTLLEYLEAGAVTPDQALRFGGFSRIKSE